ncbi:MAG: NAD-dependent epimerase/dehydratase family protein [Candidatus Krumholzibacteriia bacterium]
MECVVTGSSGFIGAHLTRRLLVQGHSVLGIDLVLCDPELAREFPDRFRFHLGDVNDEGVVDAIVGGGDRVDRVYHLAAVVGVARTQSDPWRVLRDIEGLRRVCEACRNHRVRQLLYTSSSEIYGEAAVLPTPESAALDVRHPYAAVKAVGEQMIATLACRDGIPAVAVRLFNVYGPGQRAGHDGFVVSNFVERARRGTALQIFGDGEQTRDFLFIEDCLRAVELVLESAPCRGEAINVGNGQAVTINELAALVIAAHARGGRVDIRKSPVRCDVRHRQADATRLFALGYQPCVDLPAGIARFTTPCSIGASDARAKFMAAGGSL